MDKKTQKGSKILYILLVLAIICYLILYAYALKIRSYHPIENCSSILTTVGKNKIFKKEITKIEIKHGYDYITTLTDPEDIQKICDFVKEISGYENYNNTLITTWVYSINFHTKNGDFLAVGISPGDFRIRKKLDGKLHIYKSDKIYYDDFKKLLNRIMQ
ncbi:MAG: hypothetical protein IKL68_02875 [Clostridia bacterium]|nr:hypothetical protein [Clostridia bacterium]